MRDSNRIALPERVVGLSEGLASEFAMHSRMRRRKTPAFVMALGCALASLTCDLVAADSFTRSVQPFLQKHCVECHDSETKKGRLDLTVLPSGLTNTDLNQPLPRTR